MRHTARRSVAAMMLAFTVVLPFACALHYGAPPSSPVVRKRTSLNWSPATKRAGKPGHVLADGKASNESLASGNSIDKYLISALIGTSTGFAVSAFKLTTAYIQEVAYHTQPDTLIDQSSSVITAIPALGGCVASALVFKAGGVNALSMSQLLTSPTVEGKASQQTVSLRDQFARVAAACATLGSGNSLGPEGPAVEIGVVLARTIFEISAAGQKTQDLFVGCGAAAGLAAGFNAPIAAVFFNLEVIQPMLEKPKDADTLTCVLIASAMASLVARALLEEKLSFKVGEYVMSSPIELPLYLGLGLIAGAVARAFIAASKLFESLFEGNQVPVSLRPVLAGLACGVVGTYYKEVLFFGYAALDSVLTDKGALGFVYLVELLAAKLLLTALCATSGLVGGVFAPSLFLGAAAGAAYQKTISFSMASAGAAIVALQHGLGVPPGAWGHLPEVAAAPAFAMVGAASALAGLFNAPLTGSLLLFELTQDYNVILPLMASTGIASLVVSSSSTSSSSSSPSSSSS